MVPSSRLRSTAPVYTEFDSSIANHHEASPLRTSVKTSFLARRARLAFSRCPHRPGSSYPYAVRHSRTRPHNATKEDLQIADRPELFFECIVHHLRATRIPSPESVSIEIISDRRRVFED